MANLTKKILGVAGTAMVFAGMSFGQLTNSSCPGTPTTNVPPILDRYEGRAELVSDIIVACNAGSALSGATVKVHLSLPVTSPVIDKAGDLDAVIQVTDKTTNVTSVFPGAAIPGDSSDILFNGVNFPADPFTITFSNIRVDASTAGSGANVPVYESFYILNLGTEIFNQAPSVVGYVNTGFSSPALTTGGVNPAQYVICTANPAGSASQSFAVTLTTLFGGALKTQLPGKGFTLTNGEAGSYTTAPYGAATHGTRIQLAFSSVTAGESIYLPNTITSSNDGGVTLTLTQNGTGVFKPFPGASIGAVGTPAGTVGFTPTTGATTVTAYYEATSADNTTQSETLIFPGYITANPNFASANVSPVSVTFGLAPQLPAGGTEIPDFTTNYNPIPLSGFSLCQTTLLFPFAAAGTAAAPGFDTGIAISNTGLDPLAAGLTASPGTPGACTFSFYGTNQPDPTALAKTLTGLGIGTINPGQSVAFSLASENVAPGFTGYIIAQCQFLYAHGFAYITYGGDSPVTTSEMAMGYLAEVLQTSRANIGKGPEFVTF